jgi:hypothetical protein
MAFSMKQYWVWCGCWNVNVGNATSDYHSLASIENVPHVVSDIASGHYSNSRRHAEYGVLKDSWAVLGCDSLTLVSGWPIYGLSELHKPDDWVRENYLRGWSMSDIFDVGIKQSKWRNEIEPHKIDSEPSKVSVNCCLPAVLQLNDQKPRSPRSDNNGTPSSKGRPLCPTYNRGFLYLFLFVVGVVASAVIAGCVGDRSPNGSHLIFPFGGIVFLIIFGVQMGRLSSEIRNCGSENVGVMTVIVPELRFRNVQWQVLL